MEPLSSPIRPRKWKETERQAVISLIERGATASMIARQLGLNRNVVLGRIRRDHEMKLQGDHGTRPFDLNSPSIHNATVRSRPARKPSATSAHKAGEPGGTINTNRPPLVICAAVEEPVSNPTSLAERTRPLALIDTGSLFCKWPIGWDVTVPGKHLCCGAPVARLLEVYCAKHRADATSTWIWRNKR